MYRGFLTWCLTLACLAALAMGCDLFNPQSSKVTIEVSNTYTGSGCTNFQANVDGGSNMSIGNGTYVTFPPVGTGSHTVNVSVGGGCGPACAFQNNSQNYGDSFNTTGGNVYVVKISPGSACQNLVVSGP